VDENENDSEKMHIEKSTSYLQDDMIVVAVDEIWYSSLLVV
jgi:hypothetical protein